MPLGEKAHGAKLGSATLPAEPEAHRHHDHGHLEEAGIEVVETDLGEYVVQIRGESPSHIIAPIVHLNKEAIEADFRRAHRKLPSTFAPVGSRSEHIYPPYCMPAGGRPGIMSGRPAGDEVSAAGRVEPLVSADDFIDLVAQEENAR